jgi:hypothetical protein
MPQILYNTTKRNNPMKTATIDGIQFKVTHLPVAHGASANRWANRIKGGSSRVRTGAGSRSVNQSTTLTALGDVR